MINNYTELTKPYSIQCANGKFGEFDTPEAMSDFYERNKIVVKKIRPKKAKKNTELPNNPHLVSSKRRTLIRKKPGNERLLTNLQGGVVIGTPVTEDGNEDGE